MTWLVGGALGLLGIGGGAAAIMTGFLPLAGILGGLSLGKVLDFIRSPVGMALIWFLTLLGAFTYGHHKATVKERAACEARIEASIAAAEAFDAELAAQQHAAAIQQQNEASARVAAAEQKVHEYARTHQSCSIGAAGAELLGGLSDQPVQPVQQVPPADPRRRAR